MHLALIILKAIVILADIIILTLEIIESLNK